MELISAVFSFIVSFWDRTVAQKVSVSGSAATAREGSVLI